MNLRSHEGNIVSNSSHFSFSFHYFYRLQRLSNDQASPDRLAETERRNAELFKVMSDNTKLDKPVWQVQARPELDEMLKKK